MDTSQTEMKSEIQETHRLNDEWVLWAHLPHDTNWSLTSYKHIYTFTCVEEVISVLEKLPNELVSNCMLFIMRKGINPVWEDPKNRGGGCFSYKVNNKSVYKDFTYSKNRFSEKKLLFSNLFEKNLNDHQIKLINFSDLN